MRILRMCIWVLVIAVAFGGFIHHRSEAQAQNVIQIKGSDSEVNLVQRLAEVFMQKNPGVSIAVTGGGSGTGIAALINKTTDIANSSREIQSKEEEAAKKGRGSTFPHHFCNRRHFDHNQSSESSKLPRSRAAG